MENILTPKNIVEKLNKYIISQEEAKKDVAISLRNRYRRKKIEDKQLRDEIMPKNIILIGPTGVGKTEIARRLAKLVNAPFIKVEATKFTEVGYVGKDVESMIKDLVGLTLRMVKKEKIEKLKKDYIDEVYEEIAKKISPFDTLNDDEKNRIIEEVKTGEHDSLELEVNIKNPNMPPVIEVYSDDINDGTTGMGTNIQGMLDDLMSNIGNSKKTKTKLLTVKAAKEYLLKEKVEEKLDNDEIIPEVIEKVEQDGIIFIDEIDKIAERGNSIKGNVSRQGVQRDILPIIEGTTVMTKYGPVNTDHILFISAGAFSIASPSDLMPELQGRFPVRVNLKSLNKQDFIKILTEIDNNLLIQYKSLLKIDNVDLEFEKSGIDKIAEYAIRMNEEIENIGARRLATVLEKILKEIMFEAPNPEKTNYVINEELVEKVLKIKDEKENLEKYIL